MSKTTRRFTELEATQEKIMQKLEHELRCKVSQLLDSGEEDAYWDGWEHHKAGIPTTEAESQAHWKVCLDQQAWELLVKLVRLRYIAAGYSPPAMLTFEGVKVNYEQAIQEAGTP